MEVPTPPCARTPVKMSLSVPRSLPSSVAAIPQSTPSATRPTQVAKLIVSGSSLSGVAQTTPVPTPKHTPHATPVRHVSSGDVLRCRRSETAPSPLPVQADSTPGFPSSRLVLPEPASPISTTRNPVAKTPIGYRVTRAQTSGATILDSTIYTLESLDEINFRNPALQECENNMANMVRQLEKNNMANRRTITREDGSHIRAGSAGITFESRRINENGTVPDLRTFTEMVKSCGQSMRRASTAVGEEVTCRRTSFELPASAARSVTLKPRCRRRSPSPLLRATMGSLPSSGLFSPAVHCSVNAPSAACSVSVPSNAMSISGPSGGASIKMDTLSRTVPSDFFVETIQNPRLDVEPEEFEVLSDKLTRTAVVRGKPTAYSASTCPPLSFKQSQTGFGSVSGYPPRLTTSTACHTVDSRLSPRPYISSASNRSPLVSLRASPPATPGTDTFRDVVLARCNTVGTVHTPAHSVPIAVPAL
jgi:hypothetical protein